MTRRRTKSREDLVLMFGRAIREVRKARGLTQKELAGKMAVHPRYVSLVETGSRTPSVTFLASTCKALRVPPAVLLFQAAKPLTRNQRKLRALARAKALVRRYWEGQRKA